MMVTIVFAGLFFTTAAAAAPGAKHHRLQATVAQNAWQLRTPQDSEGVPYYLFIPQEVDSKAPPLITIHGISRRADEHFAAFKSRAERGGRVLIAPLFTDAGCRRYQQVILDRCRADRALFATLREISAATGINVDRFDLFGFSGGAQFAHRFALLHPRRVIRLAVASAGWYTLPDETEPYPYGLAPPSRDRQRFTPKLEDFLAIPTLVLVGEQDIERDATLRKERRVDQHQGLTRLERGARWSQALRRAAAANDVTAKIRFQALPGCGHSFEDCVRDGRLVETVMAWFTGS